MNRRSGRRVATGPAGRRPLRSLTFASLVFGPEASTAVTGGEGFPQRDDVLEHLVGHLRCGFEVWQPERLVSRMVLGFGEQRCYQHYYRLAAAAIRKAMTFWYDRERHISDRWYGGRCTDPYMGKSRILDSTLDLYLRLMQAHDMLRELEPLTWPEPQQAAPVGGRLFRHSDEAGLQKATFVYRTDALTSGTSPRTSSAASVRDAASPCAASSLKASTSSHKVAGWRY